MKLPKQEPQFNLEQFTTPVVIGSYYTHLYKFLGSVYQFLGY
jgi:hypothetical protein